MAGNLSELFNQVFNHLINRIIKKNKSDTNLKGGRTYSLILCSDFYTSNFIMTKGENFQDRHIGPNEHEISEMLSVVGASSVDGLISEVVPADIRLNRSLNLPDPLSREYLDLINEKAAKNKNFKNHIGQGYYGTFTPSPILRNVFESPE